MGNDLAERRQNLMFWKRRQTYPRIVSINHQNKYFPTLASDALPVEPGWYVIEQDGLHPAKSFSTDVATEEDPLIFFVHMADHQIDQSEIYDSVIRFTQLSPTGIDRIGYWDYEGSGTTYIYEVAFEQPEKRHGLSIHSLEMTLDVLKSISSKWQ